MTAVDRGKRITWAIAIWSAAPAVLINLFMAPIAIKLSVTGWLINLVFPIVLSWMLIRGSPWMRILTIVGFGYGAVRIVIRLVATLGSVAFETTLTLAVLGAIQIAAALVLWLSDDVRAYFDRENQPAALNLSSESQS